MNKNFYEVLGKLAIVALLIYYGPVLLPVYLMVLVVYITVKVLMILWQTVKDGWKKI